MTRPDVHSGAAPPRNGGLLRQFLVDRYNDVLALGYRTALSLRFMGKGVSVHPSSDIAFRSIVRANSGGRISIGRNCEIHPYAILMTYGGDIHIGDNCSVNPYSVIYGHGGVRVGNGVRIATHVVIVPANHVPGTDEVPLHRSGITARGIVIEDGVWLGAGCRILDGVTIGRNAVVAAGCVVTRTVPANATVGGVPARVLKQR